MPSQFGFEVLVDGGAAASTDATVTGQVVPLSGIGSGYLPLSGGTITGSLILNGNTLSVQFQTAGVPRYAMIQDYNSATQAELSYFNGTDWIDRVRWGASGTDIKGQLTVTSPSNGATLDVLRIHNSGSGANTAAQLAFYAASTNYAQITGGYGAASPVLTYNVASNGYHAWSNAGSEQLRLDSSGNLGLGVTPSVWRTTGKALQINNYGSLYSSTSGDTSVINNAYLNAGATAWVYLNTAQASRYEQYLGGHTWFTAASGTAGTNITFTQAMTLDSSGNLNVGPANSNSTLTAGGSLLFKNTANTAGYELGLLGGSADPNAYIYQRAGAALIFGTNNNDRMRIDTSGNVGVGVAPSSWGTTARAVTLKSTGSAIEGSFCNSGATNATSLVNNAYYNAGWKYVYSGGSYAAARYDLEAGVHSWYTAAAGTAGAAVTFTQAMTLDSSGNLGIGMAPVQKLDVTGGVVRFTNPQSLILNGSTGTYVTIQNNGTSMADFGTANNIISGSNGLEFGLSTRGAYGLLFGIATVEKMRLDASGNLLVGTTTAAGKIAAAGNIRSIGGNFELDSGQLTTNAGANPLLLGVNGTERMRIDNGGYVGVGVAPSAWTYGGKGIELTNNGFVAAAGPNFTLFANVYYNGANWIYKTTAASSYYSQQGGAHTWGYAASGTAGTAITYSVPMTLDAGGNLLVGTTSALRRLTVGGGANAYMAFQTQSYRTFTMGSEASGFILYDDTAAAYRMVMDGSGNTTFYNSIQCLNGNPLFILRDSDNSGTGVGQTGYVSFQDSGGVERAYLGYQNSGSLDFAIYNSRGLLNLNGNVTVTTSGNMLFPTNGTIYSTGALYVRAGASGVLHLGSNDTNSRVVIDTAGNVGIGTTSPAAKLSVGVAQTNPDNAPLQVSGTVEICNISAQTYRGMIETDGQTVYINSNQYYSGAWTVYDATRAPAAIRLRSDASASVISFHTSTTNSGEAPERGRIDANGDMVLGNTTVARVLSDRTLYVEGSAYASINLACGGAYGGAGMTIASDGALSIRNSGAERIRIDSSGNVSKPGKIVPNVQSSAAPTTITPNANVDDLVEGTALTAGVTIANHTGTPSNGQKLIVRLKDNGTTRTIGWGTAYVAGGAALPTGTTAGKWHTIGFIYSTTATAWLCVAAVVQA